MNCLQFGPPTDEDSARDFSTFRGPATKDELLRLEVMNDLNKWAVNDTRIAKATALTLIALLQQQFNLTKIMEG